ncbi:MAG: isoprenyl transferase [Deltaproteobacteria bacterium]|nr:isoprenyl transferase [Deltaproteobacteria bacterium]
MDLKKVPQHVAIIMDGNGRWATRRNLPRIEGHRQGVETVDSIVTAAHDLKIQYLTLYAFSHENWNRPIDEVKGLMDLLTQFLISKREKMIQKQIRFRTIGDIDSLPESVKCELSTTQEMTQHHQQMTLILALSYGARNEIVKAVNRAIVSQKDKSLLSVDQFQSFLDTAEYPDPDLLIRTSGEHRMSNFLLWQMAYTELFFTETLWPDFTPKDFNQAILEYQSRERRFGLTSDQIREF